MTDGMSYIAKLPCGCVVGAVVDKPDDLAWAKTVASNTSKWIRDGLIVERVADQVVRDSNWKGCEVCKPESDNGEQLSFFEEV
jgi:hypothetical protein